MLIGTVALSPSIWSTHTYTSTLNILERACLLTFWYYICFLYFTPQKITFSVLCGPTETPLLRRRQNQTRRDQTQVWIATNIQSVAQPAFIRSNWQNGRLPLPDIKYIHIQYQRERLLPKRARASVPCAEHCSLNFCQSLRSRSRSLSCCAVSLAWLRSLAAHWFASGVK